MATTSKGRTAVSAGFSIDPKTYDAAKRRADSLGMRWSEYVRRCLEADIDSAGEIVIRPKTPTTTPSKRKW